MPVQTTQTLSAFTYTMPVCPDILLRYLCMTTLKGLCKFFANKVHVLV